MHIPNIKSKDDVVHYVNEVGYLPFFRNHISGFSLEDMVEPIYWYDGFSDKEIKWPAWSWREEIAKDKSLLNDTPFLEGRSTKSPPLSCRFAVSSTVYSLYSTFIFSSIFIHFPLLS